MTTYACPEGHQSSDPDWCDTCGARIGAAPADPAGGTPSSPGSSPSLGGGTSPTAVLSSPAATPPPEPAATAPSGATVDCPNCGAANQVDALFCESCGYDFTTGQAPPPAPGPATAGVSGAAEGQSPSSPSGAPDAPVQVIVIVAIDPAWFAVQGEGAAEPCPPAAVIEVTVRGTAVLVGRTSSERSVVPDVALDDDPGVSRRHAQFVRSADGSWSVVDLGSMNGTFVSPDGAVPTGSPTPIAAGEPVAVPDGAAVFVGAWTRLSLTLPTEA